MKNSEVLRLFVAAALLCAGGCGGSSVPLHKISGKVTFNGQPVVGASVNFIPKDKATAKHRAAQGITREDGSYDLGTNVTGDGAMEGSYVITVAKRPAAAATPKASKALTPSGPSKPGEAAGGESQDYAKMMIGKSAEELDAQNKQPSDIPAKYAKEESTDLFATVAPDGPKKFDFDLKP